MRFEQPSWVDPDLYLMADEALVETAERAAFRVCRLDKHPEPVLLPEQPWEGGDGERPRPVQQDPLDGSVLYAPEEETYYLWYRHHSRLLSNSFNHATGRRVLCEGAGTCLATSRDGLHWEKPVVGTVRFGGSYANNMVRVAQGAMLQDHLSGVVPNHLPGQEGRLVATVFSKFDDPLYPMGITQCYSADGIRWEPHLPPTLPYDGDAHCLMWDPNQECYLCTTRSWVHGREVRRMQEKGFDVRNKRHVAIARSRDLLHWSPMTCVLEADGHDPPNAQLYYMYVIPYGHGYVGLVQLFYMQERLMTYGPLDMQLAFSRDLMTWRRVGDRTPVIQRGPGDSWDCAHVSVHTSPPFPEGDRMRFWYGGKDTEHWQAGNAGVGTGTLRRDGFACWEAGDEEGCVTTAPMRLQWAISRFFLNVEAPRGEVSVEILDAQSGVPLDGAARADCRPISGDHLRAQVHYGERRGTFIRHSGTVRLRFHLRNARLYAFVVNNLAPTGSDGGEIGNPWL